MTTRFHFVLRRIGLCLVSSAMALAGTLALLVLMSPPPMVQAAAATYPGCGPTIQACLNAAAAGATVLVQPGVYTESLTVSKAVSLTGALSETTIIHALPGQRVITVTGAAIDASVVISGLTFTGGNSTTDGGGMLIQSGARPQLQNLIFAGNTAHGRGGGLAATDPLTLVEVVFLNNVSTGTVGHDGGGASLGDATIIGGLFSGNVAATATPTLPGLTFGGGLSAGALTLTGTRFVGNVARGWGGGLSANSAIIDGAAFIGNQTELEGGGLYAFGPLWITATVFHGNRSDQDGGGLYMEGPAILAAVTLISNTASSWGGGLYNLGPLEMRASEVSHNQAGAGGGLYVVRDLTLTDSHLSDNAATAEYAGEPGRVGGGALVVKGKFIADSTTFIANSAGADGGAALIADLAIESEPIFDSFSLTNCSFVANTAQRYGGGLFSSLYLTITAANTSFLSNTAHLSGGGLYAQLAYSLTLDHSRFLNNRSEADGGALVFDNVMTASLWANQFLDNAAFGQGGGLYLAERYGSAADTWLSADNNLFGANHSASGAADIAFDGINRHLLVGRHNTFASGVTGQGLAIRFTPDGRALLLTNTIFAGYAVGLQLARAPIPITLDHVLWSDVLTPTMGSTVTVLASRVGPAGFVDAATRDYHLGPASAARSRGVNAGLDVDFEGDPRPSVSGGGFDLGADQALAPVFFNFLPSLSR